MPQIAGERFDHRSTLKDDTKKFTDIEVSNRERVLKQLKGVIGNAESFTSSEMQDALSMQPQC